MRCAVRTYTQYAYAARVLEFNCVQCPMYSMRIRVASAPHILSTRVLVALDAAAILPRGLVLGSTSAYWYWPSTVHGPLALQARRVTQSTSGTRRTTTAARSRNTWPACISV